MKSFLLLLTLLAVKPAFATRTVLAGSVNSPGSGKLVLYYYRTVTDRIEDKQTRAAAPVTGGKYRFVLDLVQPVSVFLKDGEKWLSYSNYLAPGDSLVLSFGEKADAFDGGCGECNVLIFDQIQRFYRDSAARAERDAAQGADFSTHARYLVKLREGSLAMLDSHFREEPAPEGFPAYYRAEQDYSYAARLLRRSWSQPALMWDSSYNRLLHQVSFSDAAFLASSQYLDFLRELPYSSWRALMYSQPERSAGRSYYEREQYRLRDSVARTVFTGEPYDVALFHIFNDRLEALEARKAMPFIKAEKKALLADVRAAEKSFTKPVYYHRLIQRLYQMNGKKVAPDFEMRDLQGNTVRLSDFRGKVVYVDFWATSCAPCMAQLPHLRLLEDHFAGKEVVFLFVSLGDNKEQLQQFLKVKDFPGLHLSEPLGFASEAAAAYRISGLPKYLLIDRHGMLVSADAPRPSAHPESQIEALLAEK